jgi:predicted redox protein, regulator of disulfide bond formation
MVDARGCSCPEPVIMIKKALASKESRYEMLVDSKNALENVTRFVNSNGYNVEVKEENGEYKLVISK